MSEKQRPRTNPRAGSNDPELWDLDLDWYFNDFESHCGLQSIGTSGAGENELVKPTEEETRIRKERMRNGFLLTMPERAKADLRSTSASEADQGAFDAMCYGIFGKGRRIWVKLSALDYATQALLKQAYEERIPEAGADWGRRLLTDEQVRWAHRQFSGAGIGEPAPQRAAVAVVIRAAVPWVNPKPSSIRHNWDSK